jgi:myo-inositol-1(or 4)-monophosphatase
MVPICTATNDPQAEVQLGRRELRDHVHHRLRVLTLTQQGACGKKPRVQRMLEGALRAAAAAGSVLKSCWGRASDISYKGPVDLVTDADVAAERVVVSLLREAFPDHGIVAEESVSDDSTARYRWYVDPLDGTTNFAHRLPHFAVSIALACDGEIIIGVVNDPMRDEVFAAARGGGATLNGVPIRVSKTATLDRALLGTGFPYDRRQHAGFYLQAFERFLTCGQDIRRGGSAALDLCYVGCGRLDGFWEWALRPWDTAAGTIIVTEAGGAVSDFRGAPYRLDGPGILASNGLIATGMIDVLTPLATHPARGTV